MNWQERAEKAESELAKLREQEPIKYLYRVTDCFGHDVLRDDPKGATILETIPLYAAPIPAPAVPSGWNIRRDGDVLIVQHPDIGGCSVQKEPDWERMIPEAILYSLADALLQSRAVKDSLTTQADCRACVNRGRVNWLSQETYCESCVHEGRNWRKNHFLDAAADRLLEGGE